MLSDESTESSAMQPEILNKIKRDYALGKASLSSLSEACGLKPLSIKRRAYTEKWAELRGKYMNFEPVLETIDQIRQLDEMIRNEQDAKNLDSLHRARQRAFGTLWGITGHPKPPTAKPPRERNIAREKMLKALTEDDRPKVGKKGKRTVDQSVNQADTPQDVVVEGEPIDLSQYTIS